MLWKWKTESLEQKGVGFQTCYEPLKETGTEWCAFSGPYCWRWYVISHCMTGVPKLQKTMSSCIYHSHRPGKRRVTQNDSWVASKGTTDDRKYQSDAIWVYMRQWGEFRLLTYELNSANASAVFSLQKD